MFTVKEERTLRRFYGMAALRVGNGSREPTYWETVAFRQRLGKRIPSPACGRGLG